MAGSEDDTPSAGLERWTAGSRWCVRTIRVYDLTSCPLPALLTIVLGDTRICVSHFSSMKRRYTLLKNKITKRPFDELAVDISARIGLRHPAATRLLPGPTLQTTKTRKTNLLIVGAAFLSHYSCTDLPPFDTLFRRVWVYRSAVKSSWCIPKHLITLVGNGLWPLKFPFIGLYNPPGYPLLYEQVTLSAPSDHSLRLQSPTLCDPHTKQYSGYLDVSSSGRSLRYWNAVLCVSTLLGSPKISLTRSPQDL